MHLSLNRHQQFAVAWTISPVILVWQFNGVYLAALASMGKAPFWIADFFQWVVLPSVLLVVLAKKADVLPRHYGFARANNKLPQQLLETLAVFLTTGIAFFAVRNIAWRLLNYPAGFFSFPNVFPDGLMGTVVWIYSAVTAGIVESIFFIALPWLLYRSIRQFTSRTAYILLASVVFAAAHWEQGPHVVIGAFSYNLIACYWFFRFGSLWPVVGGHILVDLVAFS